jgi:Mitochondrial carrier protein
MLEGRYASIWQYSTHKLKEIGFRGIFAGWSMSLLKDSTSCALFFGTFEYTKAQLFYQFLPKYYHAKIANETPDPLQPIRPHYMLEPVFILTAGVAASFAQQSVQYPLNQLQDLHFTRLESLDYRASMEKQPARIMQVYYHAYLETFAQAKIQASLAGGWRAWLYKDFLWNTIRQTPSTSAGLIMFEILRRKYADSIVEQIIVLDNIPFQL